jgi:hypothetical protein
VALDYVGYPASATEALARAVSPWP